MCLQTRHTTQTHNLGLSEDVRAQFPAFLQDAQCLFRWDVDLQGRRDGGLDEAVDDCGNLLLDGDVITVGVTQVLHSEREGDDLGLKTEVFSI